MKLIYVQIQKKGYQSLNHLILVLFQSCHKIIHCYLEKNIKNYNYRYPISYTLKHEYIQLIIYILKKYNYYFTKIHFFQSLLFIHFLIMILLIYIKISNKIFIIINS